MEAHNWVRYPGRIGPTGESVTFRSNSRIVAPSACLTKHRLAPYAVGVLGVARVVHPSSTTRLKFVR
jgi:hypothetical protein